MKKISKDGIHLRLGFVYTVLKLVPGRLDPIVYNLLLID